METWTETDSAAWELFQDTIEAQCAVLQFRALEMGRAIRRRLGIFNHPSRG